MGDLGRRLRDVYQAVADESGPSEGDIRDAFATLIGAWNQVAGTLTNAFQDPEVRGHLKSAAGALTEAVGATLRGLGDELGVHDEEE